MAGLEFALNTGERTRGPSLLAPGLLHLAVPTPAPIFLAGCPLSCTLPLPNSPRLPHHYLATEFFGEKNQTFQGPKSFFQGLCFPVI